MSRLQRNKGVRVERQIVGNHKALGVHAERVGVAYRPGADVDVYPFGVDHGALTTEVKARGSGHGFVTLERWLGKNDALFLVRDRSDPLVCLPWRTWELILRCLQKVNHEPVLPLVRTQKVAKERCQ